MKLWIIECKLSGDRWRYARQGILGDLVVFESHSAAEHYVKDWQKHVPKMQFRAVKYITAYRKQK